MQIFIKPVTTPFDPNLKLYPNTGRAVDQLKYAKIIGCLMYVMTCTGSDIAYAVGKLSRYTSCPSAIHWNAVTKILRYLKEIRNYGICLAGILQFWRDTQTPVG